MIHLVTDHRALADCLPWLQDDDQLMLMGSAVAEAHRLHANIPQPVHYLTTDASRFNLPVESARSPVAWAQALLDTPVRTWS